MCHLDLFHFAIQQFLTLIPGSDKSKSNPGSNEENIFRYYR